MTLQINTDFDLLTSFNWHLSGDNLAEDATEKTNAGRKRNVKRDDILKCLECLTVRLKEPSGLSSLLASKFNC